MFSNQGEVEPFPPRHGPAISQTLDLSCEQCTASNRMSYIFPGFIIITNFYLNEAHFHFIVEHLVLPCERYASQAVPSPTRRALSSLGPVAFFPYGFPSMLLSLYPRRSREYISVTDWAHLMPDSGQPGVT